MSSTFTAAPFKVHYAPTTRPQAAERRQLRSPPPKPKSKLFSLSIRRPSRPRKASPKLDETRRVEFWPPAPPFWTVGYTLISLEEAQKRNAGGRGLDTPHAQLKT
ncbi:hypothetical protein BD413DRAFT_493463 [Trametes elegans]|nr:hypothetical protein BD413DRAFT_493463 [Trametes elegans]